MIHSPHMKVQQPGGATGDLSDINLLNINQQVVCVATGCLDDASERETLVVGTATNLMAYDVDKNTDLFYKDVSSVDIFLIVCIVQTRTQTSFTRMWVL